MSAPSIETPGEILRSWRLRRGRSQLHLALEADVSTRHLSFLENGRSNPSREMVVHLGMTGELRVEPPGYVAAAHDHLILVQRKRLLVFKDPRMFGGVRFHHGKTAPGWWTKIAPAILSAAFTVLSYIASQCAPGR